MAHCQILSAALHPVKSVRQETIVDYRYYQTKDVGSLNFIRRCKELRMPLVDIKKLVAVQSDGNAPCAGVDSLIYQQLEQIHTAQYELQQLEEHLQALANCCANQQIKDCEILQHLNAD